MEYVWWTGSAGCTF